MVDPGFPMGGVDLRCGCFSPKMYTKMKELGPVVGGGPPMQVLFTKNVCENERIVSCRGRVLGMPPRSASALCYKYNVFIVKS